MMEKAINTIKTTCKVLCTIQIVGFIMLIILLFMQNEMGLKTFTSLLSILSWAPIVALVGGTAAALGDVLLYEGEENEEES